MICFLLAGALSACGGSQAASSETAQDAESAARKKAPKVTVTPTHRKAIPGKLPEIALDGPKSSLQLASEVWLKIKLKNWNIGPAPGKHVHLIVDNQPYIAIRDVSKPINLSKLYQNTFKRPLENGTHVVRLFPSRATHESVKRGSPFIVQTLYIGKPSSDFRFNARAPLLTYSRPKGCYPVGQPVMLDFYVSNTSIGPDSHKVRVWVDAVHVGDLINWSPHMINNLTEGNHNVRLQLIDRHEKPTPGPFNDTSREIRLATDC